MNFKKIVSAVSALAISVSAFAGLAVTANAATGDVVAGTTVYIGGATDTSVVASATVTPAADEPNLSILLDSDTVTFPKRRISTSVTNNTGVITLVNAYDLTGGIDKNDVSITWNQYYTGNTYGTNGKRIIKFLDSNGEQVLPSVTNYNWGNIYCNWDESTSSAVSSIGKELAGATAFEFKITTNASNQRVATLYANGTAVTDSFELKGNDIKTVNLFVGNVNDANRVMYVNALTLKQTEALQAEPVNYTVQYMCGNVAVKTAEIRTGYAGTAPEITSADKADVDAVSGTRYLYTSDDSEGMVINADGSTVVTVTFTEATPVTKLTRQYVANGNVVATINDTLTGKYVDDKYTYMDAYYVNGTDGKIYKTNADMYTADQNFGVVYNGTTKQYLKTVTLDTAGTTVVSCNVTEATGAVYFAEGEKIASGHIQGPADNSHYIASNGNTGWFRGDLTLGYTVPAAGTYQVVITNAFCRARATTLSVINSDGTAGETVLEFGGDCGGNTNGGVVVTTAHLDEGEKLKMTGYGNSSNYSTYIDYVLIRCLAIDPTPSVSATSVVKEGYITFKGEIANAATVDKAGFGFINAQELGNDLLALWTTNAVQGSTFGAAIKQETDKGATHSAFYAIPYIVIGDKAVFGTIVASDWNKGN